MADKKTEEARHPSSVSGLELINEAEELAGSAINLMRGAVSRVKESYGKISILDVDLIAEQADNLMHMKNSLKSLRKYVSELEKLKKSYL